MNQTILNPGETFLIPSDLTKNKITAAFGWTPAKGILKKKKDCDLAIAIYQGERLWDFIFYNNPNTTTIGAMHLGDDVTGRGKDEDGDEFIDLYLNFLSMSVNKLSFLACVYDETHDFNEVKNVFFRLYDDKKQKILEFRLDGCYENRSAIHIGDLSLTRNGWDFEAIGKGLIDINFEDKHNRLLSEFINKNITDMAETIK
jgi:stress response protein SCP2